MFGEYQNLICSALKSLQNFKFRLHTKPKEGVQAETVDWCGSVSSNFEEFVGFDRAWLGSWR